MRVIHCGLIEYEKARQLQKDLVQEVIAGAPGALVLCEHPATLTLGRAHHAQNILASQDELGRRGVSVIAADRGGDVTLHAPGQLIAYPIVDLKAIGRDLTVYLGKLEQTCVDFLLDFGIVAEQGSSFSSQGQMQARGVWVDRPEGRAKIASIGIGVSRWVTYHGIGVNISTDLELFKLIRPCGLDVAMTSIEKLTGQAPPVAVAAKKFADRFLKVFHDKDRSS